MELEKQQNMIDHQDEIFSRPARTWFQTTKEKRKSRGALKEKHLNFGLHVFTDSVKQPESTKVRDTQKVHSCFPFDTMNLTLFSAANSR